MRSLGVMYALCCHFLSFFFGCAGSPFWHTGLSSLGVMYALCFHFLPFLAALGLCSGTQVSRVVAHGLSYSMWDLSSPARNGTQVPCIGRLILDQLTPMEVPMYSL